MKLYSVSLRHALPLIELRHTAPMVRGLVVVLGTGVLAASSAVAIPVGLVPVTMQTYAVLLVGALCGPYLGVAVVAAWLLEAGVGLPVLAGGRGGLVALLGPTAGYLIGFLPAIAFIGWFASRGGTRHILKSFAAMLAAHLIILVSGVLWLSPQLGWARSLAIGLTPFLGGSVLKSVLLVVTLTAVRLGRGGWSPLR